MGWIYDKLRIELKIGDKVVPKLKTMEHYFKEGPGTIEDIDDYNGLEGNRVKIIGHDRMYWSKYLQKI